MKDCNETEKFPNFLKIAIITLLFFRSNEGDELLGKDELLARLQDEESINMEFAVSCFLYPIVFG